ncbi:MAG: alpha-amylase family glycosyl hydrolase [Pseudomonadota bacterium]|nr:alpha-amylase family glycosyl hydrolase [Pseudomonadota bacterium]
MSSKLKNSRTTTTKRTATPGAKSSTTQATAKPSVASISQEHIDNNTPMGATLIANGATFRVWAPNKGIAVHVRITRKNETADHLWKPSTNSQLMRRSDDTWAGFMPDVSDGDHYRFYIAGRGEQPYKRDPYARELEFDGYPDCDCIIRDSNSYPWHDQEFRTPAFNDLVIYQLHVGRFYATHADGSDARTDRVGKFLDILDRIEYLAALGINAIEPLPIAEFQGPHSLGYNGTDYFSPEMDYAVKADELAPYLTKINTLLTAKGCAPLTEQQLEGQVNQLKALVDICHLHGIAVILDVVYNHAGGFGDDDQGLYFFDRAFTGDNNDSQYFTDKGHAGGMVFAYWKQEVRQFLIDNAKFFLTEYHVDGFRYDQVTVIDDDGGAEGWRFLQDLTNTLHFVKPSAINIAEYWRDDQSWAIRDTTRGGAGFDAVWYAGLRHTVRELLAQAATGENGPIEMNALRDVLYRPAGFDAAWRTVQHLENHDLQYSRKPRIAELADSTSAHSWYARSRARVANGLLFTAPGIPMLFMGQEFLEDKDWSDSPDSDKLIWWEGLEQEPDMANHLRFTQELLKLRSEQPALRGEAINVFHVHESNRVIAWHRWVEGAGKDVIVVASLSESTYNNYQIGLPQDGKWHEVFNSDVYDNYPNPQAAGNSDTIYADETPMDGLPCSASIVIPANSILIFAREST